MAIFHLSVKNGSSSHATAHASYILREGAYAARDEDLRASESGNMPAWAEAEPALFWASADLYERANGRPYKELEIALPRELNDAQRVDLVRDFVSNVLGDRHAYTWAIHAPKASDEGEQPHVHLMFSERRHDGIARDPEQFFRRWNADDPTRGGAGKDRYFNSQKFVWDIRSEWAELANEHLARAGIESRIDPRSYRDQGLELEPQAKRGPEFHADDRQVLSAITLENRERMRRNGDAILAKPTLALDALTAHQSTFTKRELQQFLLRNTDSPEQFEAVSLKVLNAPELLALEGKDGSERFTSKALAETESQLVRQAAQLARQDGKGIDEAVRAAVAEGRNFNAGQQDAFEKLTSKRVLASVNGAAGTGKSYVLKSVREAYEQAGYRVLGAALQGRTAEDLDREAGIASSTIHRLLSQLDRNEVRFDAKTVLVIDEAGLVGSQQLGQLVDRVARSGASLRLVGDAYQLHAIAAGDAFGAVSHQVAEAGAAAALTQIQRQKSDWQREASQALSEHRIGDGIEAYRRRGFVGEHATQGEARAALLAQWWADRRSEPAATQLLVAHSNRERQQLNQGARAMRREAGELGQDVAVQSATGRLELAAGDRLVFLRNDTDLQVKNGSLGTVAAVSKGRISVRLDGGQRVEIDPKQYAHFDHGYSLTVHKAQGATVDHGYVLATSSMTARLAYVSMTRHRSSLRIAYSREQFAGAQDFDRKLSRVERKDFSADLMRRPFDPAQESGKRDTLAERRELGTAVPVPPPIKAPVDELTAARIEAMSAVELSAAIQRLQPPPAHLVVAASKPMQAAVAAVKQLRQTQQQARAVQETARNEIYDWKEAHSTRARLHDAGVRASYIEVREKLIAEQQKILVELTRPIDEAVAREGNLRRQLMTEVEKRQAPARVRVRELEAILKDKRDIEGVMRKIDDIARQRTSPSSGYHDSAAYWNALPAELQGLIRRYEGATPEQRQQLAKDDQVRTAAATLAQRDRGYGR